MRRKNPAKWRERNKRRWKGWAEALSGRRRKARNQTPSWEVQQVVPEAEALETDVKDVKTSRAAVDDLKQEVQEVQEVQVVEEKGDEAVEATETRRRPCKARSEPRAEAGKDHAWWVLRALS